MQSNLSASFEASGDFTRGSELYPTQDARFVRFPSRRSPVHSTKGIVSCSQPLAARAGIRILEQGGNAADAAVATAAALNVTEPTSTGIGGDCFCLFYDAKTKKTHALNGSGRSPGKPSRAQIKKDLGIPEREQGEIPFTCVQAVTVPGTAAGWIDTIEKFGSGKVTIKQVLQPAIELADEGYPVSELASYMWQGGEKLVKKASPNYAEMLKDDKNAPDGCRAPGPGEIFTNKTLANTFRSVANHGKKGFYQGPIAEAIIKVCQDLGGRLSLDDLKHHAQVGSEEVPAISLQYSGQNISEPVELWEHPPNGQGLVALLGLGLFQEMEKAGKISQFKHRDHNSAEYLHALIESFRLAFSDGGRYIGDPAHSTVPIPGDGGLLSSSYLSRRAAPFAADKAIPYIEPGNPAFTKSDTVYLSTTDQHGNGCSFINSNYAGFGTGIIPAGCGFTLQNRGANFCLGPEALSTPEGAPDAGKPHPNIYAPGKRPYHTIIPGMVTRVRDGSLHSVLGVMGGFMQPQGQVQVLLNMLVFGLNAQEALDAPRVCVEPSGGLGVDRAGSSVVYVEEGVSGEVVRGLRERGHSVTVKGGYERGMFGRGQVIRRTVEDEVQFYTGGSDCRGDGHSAPL